MFNVLLVEDNPSIRSFIKTELARLGGVAVVGEAFNESGALAWLRGNLDVADIMALDLFLEDGTGIGVLKEAKSLSPSALVVVLTNSTTPLIRARCLELGAEAVFNKLDDFDQFVAFIASHSTAR